MRIVAFRAENTASSWYRCYMWMNALRDLGHTVLFDADDIKGWSPRDVEAVVQGADVVVAGRTNQPQFFASLLTFRDFYHYKLIIDTDDLVDDLHRFHPSLTTYHSAVGTGRMMRAQYKWADGVTVSTQRLRDHTLPLNSYTYHMPNCVYPDAWQTVRRRSKELRHADDIRIYWGGGGSHYGDLLIAKPALLRLAREDRRIKLIFQNFIPDWAMQLSATQAFYVPFVEFAGYYKLFSWLCADIAIAPLEGNEHNLCKSDVKYLDYAMAEVPGVYQRVGPYASVQDGITGLLADSEDEWYEKLRMLANSASLRRSISVAAKSNVLATRHIKDHVIKYEAMLLEVAAKSPTPNFLESSKPVSEIACQPM